MQIGITTTIYGNNFGEALQAYAIRKAINTYCEDCSAELISFMCKSQSKLVKPGFELYTKQLISKNEIFDEFRKEEMGLWDSPREHLQSEDNLNYDKFVFGSDQIWNTNAWEIPEFFGSFVPLNKPKIAYAASIGVNPNIQNLKEDLFRQYIDTFEHISVRENIHCEYLKKFTEKPVYHVADPTMLIDKDIYYKWADSVNPPKPDKNYIFYYQPHSADGAIVSLVNKLARNEHYDVVHTFADIPPSMFPYNSISARFFGPKEFLSYIRDSSLVITRSFHAVVFSILFERPFYVYVDKKTGSRFESLLQTLGLQDRMIFDYIKPEDVSLSIDYSRTNELLKTFREYSINYLVDSIKN